jgi:hypothetical protein
MYCCEALLTRMLMCPYLQYYLVSSLIIRMSFIPLNMFINSPLAHLAVSQIPRIQETTPSFLLD